MALTEKEIKERLGTRDENGKPILPEFAINGDRCYSNLIRVGVGRPFFVCLPNRTYKPTPEELGVFQTYVEGLIKKAPSKPISKPTEPKD